MRYHLGIVVVVPIFHKILIWVPNQIFWSDHPVQYGIMSSLLWIVFALLILVSLLTIST